MWQDSVGQDYKPLFVKCKYHSIFSAGLMLETQNDGHQFCKAVISERGGVHQSGAHKNYGNAAELNYQLMKLSVYLLTLLNP
jgi:hypothetical protein